MEQKTEIATGISYTASSGGLAIGTVIADYWLQILSAIFLVLTYATQLYFASKRDRRDRRDRERDDRRDRAMKRSEDE